MSDYLSSLVNIISSGVKSLESAYAKDGVQFPSIDEPYKPSSLSQADAVNDATRLIVAAAAQLIASVRTPVEVISEHASGMYSTVTLRFVNDNNVVDVLKEAGPEGLDAKEIGRRIGMDSNYVARCLRYLATRHIFREVKPNVFANNRLSSILVKAKPFEAIEADQMTKYDGAHVSALVGHTTEEAFMSAQCFGDFIKDRRGYASPFSMAIKEQVNIFDWYERPANQWRAHRFASAMKSSAGLWGEGAFSSAFDWNALPAGSTVVDVGGSIGLVTMEIARRAPHLRYIIQDLEAANEEAKRYWAKEWPEAIADGTVSLEVHSFFEPMPIAADLYFLRAIIHDWPEADCQKILGHIHAAAKPTSKLILYDMMMLHACPDELSGNRVVPYPLLENLGIGGGGFITMADMQMLTLLDGRERTPREFEELGKVTGWKLESVKPGPMAAFIFSKI